MSIKTSLSISVSLMIRHTCIMSTLYFCLDCMVANLCLIDPFKPELNIVIFMQYKPRIAVAILDLYWMIMI